MSKSNLKNQRLLSKTKGISVIIIVFLSILNLGCIYNKSFAASNIIEIRTAEELWSLARTIDNYSGKTIRLMNDIDLGCNENNLWPGLNKGYSFEGKFDGNGYTIKNMYMSINKPNDGSYAYVGFIGRLAKEGYISNTFFYNCVIEKNNSNVLDILYAGIVVGESEGKINNCKTSNCRININNCNVKYDTYIGGIVGATNNMINSCTSSTKINIESTNIEHENQGNRYICGGIAGKSNGIVKYSINNASITNKVGSAGGIVGFYKGEKIVYCKNTGNITVSSEKNESGYGGGIIGIAGNSFEYGMQEKSKNFTVFGCANRANIKGERFRKSKNTYCGVYLGGIIGGIGITSNNYISNCYVIGVMSLDNSYNNLTRDKNKQEEQFGGVGMGGIIGLTNFHKPEMLKIYNMYIISTIQNKGYAGALIGKINPNANKKISLITKNIYKTTGLKDKGNESNSYWYYSNSKYKKGYIKNIKTNSNKKLWSYMKNNKFPTELNRGSTIFFYDKYKLNGGYPYIKALERGWKTINGKRYYFLDGECVTGLKTIFRKQYYFDKNGVLDEVAPKISIKYSTHNKTKGNVKVTITANEEIQKIDGWNLLENKKVLTKTFTSNATNKITIRDLTGNSISKTITVNNIDKEKAKLTIKYSNTKPTKGKVQVTITANEEIKKFKGWKLSKNKKILTKIYNKNIEEKIKIQDLVGNESTINIVIRNIDKKISKLSD